MSTGESIRHGMSQLMVCPVKMFPFRIEGYASRFKVTPLDTKQKREADRRESNKDGKQDGITWRQLGRLGIKDRTKYDLLFSIHRNAIRFAPSSTVMWRANGLTPTRRAGSCSWVRRSPADGASQSSCGCCRVCGGLR